MTDDRDTHEDDDSFDTEEGEQGNIENDDGDDTENTDDESDDSKADKAKEDQKRAWLDKIKTGKKSIDDMPENLGWLKKEIKADLEKGKKPEKSDLSAEIRKALQEERASDEFDILIEDLQESEITAEQEAVLKEEYESLIGEFINPTSTQKVKALKIARRLAGMKSSSEHVRERRMKGMTLPPLSNRKRSTAKKEELTEIEKRLGGNLPPGFKA